MNFLVLVICGLLSITSYVKTGSVLNPQLLFNIWWGFTVFLSGFGFYDMEIPSSNTYIVIMVAVLSFNLPLMFPSLSKKRNDKPKKNSVPFKKINVISINNFLKWVLRIVVIYYIYRLFKMVPLVFNGINYDTIRYMYFYDREYFTLVEQMFSIWLITPIVYFSMIYNSLGFFKGENSIHKQMLIITLFIIVLFSFITGSRSIVLGLFIVIFFSYVMTLNQKQSRKRTVKYMMIITLIFISSLVIISMFRGNQRVGDFQAVFKTAIVYFTAPYIYFEKLTEYVVLHQDQIYFFGLMFFAGILDFLFLLLRVLGIQILQPTYFLAEFNQTFLLVGDGLYYNAFPTMIYTFLYDFGILGIVIGPLLFGVISMAIYKKSSSTKNIFWQGSYIVIMLMIFESIMKWLGTTPYPWIILILFYFLQKLTYIETENQI